MSPSPSPRAAKNKSKDKHSPPPLPPCLLSLFFFCNHSFTHSSASYKLSKIYTHTHTARAYVPCLSSRLDEVKSLHAKVDKLETRTP